MNLMNIFAMLFAFIIGLTLLWLLGKPILRFITETAKNYPELAILMAVAFLIMGSYFIIVNPLGIGHHDEK